MDTKVLKEEIAKGMRSYKAFENAHDTLTAIEGLEQAEKDLTAKVRKLAADIDGLGKQKSELSGAVDEAKNTADKIVSDAKDEAEKIISEAKALADAAASKTVKSASDDLAKIKQDINSNKEVLKGILTSIEDGTAELKTLTDKLAAAKDAAKRMLGV